MTSAEPTGGQHLCVLVHGLWGNPNHLKNVVKCLGDKHPELHLLVAERNSEYFTYDGIELGGERVCQEIEEEIEKLARAGSEVKRLSLVGYSLGGLVCRYTIGLLHSKGILDRIEPVNFTTFASPHLGVRTPLRGYLNHLWNVLGARTLSVSGRQLFTIDNFRDTGRPLLSLLADPNTIFMQGLARFQRRTLYCNIVNDRSAVYYTTGIFKTDPFSDLENIKINYLKGYDDVLVDPELPVSPSGPDTSAKSAASKLKDLPLYLGLSIFIPIASVVFLLNALIQSVRSYQRIRLHEAGKAGIDISNYRVPLLISSVQEVVEDAYENLNSAQGHEFVSETEESKTKPADAPTLALTEDQFAMIEALDQVGWRKYPVHIQMNRHSHAAIIIRMDKPSFVEGYTVLRHWLDEEFVV